MKAIVLSSGSKGNTTYIQSGNTKLLVDCGNSCRYIISKLKKMGIDSNSFDAILITHTHVDHVKGLKVFLKNRDIPVYVTNGMLGDLDYLNNYNVIKEDNFYINDLKINVIKTSHDSPDSVGYIISNGDKSLVYVTDTGYINNKYFDILSNRDLYVMESNHDVEMLSNSSYPFRVRQRILGDKGHLSNYDSARYLSCFVGDKTKCIVLAHLSEENNTEELAYDTLVSRLSEASKNVDKIIVAKQDVETELIEI
ncbi:MAG: MBL fold metallo-hydrolase [Bacilli bacterium]|nr:MBL fold metallo-hydrolase [Bacilli bacterium]